MLHDLDKMDHQFRNKKGRLDVLSNTMVDIKRSDRWALKIDDVEDIPAHAPRCKPWRNMRQSEEETKKVDKQQLVLDWISENNSDKRRKLKLSPISNIMYYRTKLDKGSDDNDEDSDLL